MTTKPLTPEWRSHVTASGDCLIWQGHITSQGYGRIGIRPAHRAVYEYEVAPVAAGLVLDHLCGVRSCVNPLHLEPVTQRENLMRGETIAAINARKTRCPQGHAFDLVDRNGWRMCSTCRRDAKARERVARKAVV